MTRTQKRRYLLKAAKLQLKNTHTWSCNSVKAASNSKKLAAEYFDAMVDQRIYNCTINAFNMYHSGFYTHELRQARVLAILLYREML
jgi:hypothetical protein